MKTKNCYSLFVLLFLLLGFFCISCTQKLSKPSAFTPNIDIANFLQEAFKLYNQGQLSEAAQKLEAAIQIVPQEPPSSSSVILYTLLGFFQEKHGDSERANLTFSVVQGNFQKLRNRPPESEALATKLIQIAWQLKVSDRLQFWERLRPIASASHGKAGEGGVLWQIGEAYILLNNYHKAYECSIKALKLARDSGESALEVYVSMVISKSLMGLGRIQEAEVILQEVLIKTKENPLLKANILLQLGLVNAMLGRENQSIKLFQDAITIARSIGATDLEAKIEFVFATAYFGLKKPREALKKAITALTLFEKLNDTANMANAEGVIAEVYFQNSSFKEAKHHALRAVELYRQLGNRIGEAKNLRTAGQGMAELNEVDEALKVLGKAVDIFVEERDLNESGVTYWWTIGFLRKLGRLDDIRHSLLTALDANAKIFRDKKVEVQIRNELANVYSQLGLFSEGLKQFEEIFALYKELSNTKGEIHALLNMANIYANLKDYENWNEALTLAEQLALNLDDPNIRLLILEQSARFFREFGHVVDALQRYQEGLKISQLVGKPTTCFWLGAVGHFYLEIGEYTKALDCFERGFNLAKEIGDSISMPHHLHGMVNTFFMRQEYDDALRVSHEALKIARTLKSKPDEDSALALISLALMGKSEYEAALQVEKERLKLAQESESPELSKRVYGILGYIYLQMGKYAEAVEAYKIAIEQTELLRGKIQYDIHKTGFLAKELLLGISPYDGIVEALYNLYFMGTPNKMQLPEEALFFAEKSKARVGIEQLIRARADIILGDIPLEIRKELDDLLNQAQSANRDYERTLTGYRVSDEEIEKKAKAVEIAKEKYWSFVEKLRKEYPRFGLFWSGFVIPFSELSIMDGETIIVYKVDPYWVYAWVIKKVRNKNEILKFIRIPAKTVELEKIVTKLLLPFKKVKYEQFDINASSELFDKILKPVLDGVNVSKRLIIVPDGVFNYIPFELLVTETRCGDDFKKGCFLGDQFILSYYPSVNILNFNRRVIPQTLPARGSILAVGDPIYGLDDERIAQSRLSLLRESDRRQISEIPTRGGRIRKEAQVRGYTFERLKHSGVEVQKISELFGNTRGPRDVLIGFNASESQVKLKDLTQYQYLHFAVHGILSYEVPYLKEPALVLAVDPESKEDGFLTLSEIYGLKLNSDLVTLSACKTGLGSRISGEGVIGLSRAFINAGARSVVVSLWEVADDSTALFVEEFYRLLAQGVEKAEALAKAKQKLRQMGYVNPYFWAAFILIGD